MLTLTPLRVFFLFVGLLVLFAKVDSLKCGKIWDGNTRQVEFDHTQSLTRLTANWWGFEDGNKTVIHYQYAIISHDQANPVILASGAAAPVSTRCRKDAGIAMALPDTVWFRNLPDGSYEIEKFKMNLVKGQTYYFILRAEADNDVIFTNTNGITAGTNGTYVQWVHDDDDDDFAGWKIGLITAGLIVFCLILLLLLLIVVAKSKGEDKYTTTVHRNDNVEKF